MAITNGYCTLYELEEALDPKGNATWAPSEDAVMETAIEAASRWIDAEKGTRFYAASETRYYTADYPDLLYVDDLLSVTTLKTDTTGNGTYDTTWTAADYVLEPRNASVRGQPYRQIRTGPGGSYSFPAAANAVELVGSYGYSSTAPTGIKQACLLIAQRLYKRREAIFGVGSIPAGAAGLVVVQANIQKDADVQLLLASVKSRSWV